MTEWAAFKRARAQLSAQRWRTTAAGACGVLSSIALIVLVLLLGLLGELLITTREGSVEQFVARVRSHWYGAVAAALYDRFPSLNERLHCLTVLLVVIVLVGALRAVAQYLQTRLVATAVVDASQRLRRAIHRHAYRLGTTEVSGIGVAPAINVFTAETDAVRDGVAAWLDASLREPIKIILLLAVALVAHSVLAILFLILAALGAFLAWRLNARARARADAATRHAANRLSLLQEALSMFRLYRGYLMESYEQHRFERNLGQFELSEARQLRSGAAVGPLVRWVAISCIALVGGLASYRLLLGYLSPSATVVLYASLVSLYWPATTLFERYQVARRGAESARVIFAFLDQHPTLGQIASASFLPPMARSLEFANVRLQEPGQAPVLAGVNLTVRAGTRVALMGLDERAKRSLAFLIPRFLDPTEGQIRIDGQDVRNATLESLRAQVAMVLQGELVFNDTVAGNIGCGDHSYGLPHIVDAGKIAHAHNFIQRLPRGYDTLIGDQGESLSIGQQFRIALARAILRDPTIVVIEEPFGHLDEDTKDLLDDTMSRFCPGRTVIFLPHRLSTIRTCDSIVILHNGRVETIGNHRELTLSSELYRHLQYTEFNVFATG